MKTVFDISTGNLVETGPQVRGQATLFSAFAGLGTGLEEIVIEPAPYGPLFMPPELARASIEAFLDRQR